MHLGPALSVACPACGGRVSVPWSGGMLFFGEFLGLPCLVAAAAFLLFGERMARLSVPPVVVLVLVLIPAGVLFPFAARRYRSRLRLVKR